MIETPQDDGQLLQSLYALLNQAVRHPENGQLNQTTRTSAWTVRELLFHLLLNGRWWLSRPQPTVRLTSTT